MERLRVIPPVDFSISDVCDRLEGSLARVTAILNGDIQEANSWLMKYEDALFKNAELMQENRRLRYRVNVENEELKKRIRYLEAELATFKGE